MHLSPRHRYIPSIPFYTIRQGWRGEDYGAENDLSETSIEEVWRPGRNFGRVQYFRIRGGGVSRHAMPGPGHAATSRNLYTWFVASPPPPAPDQINSLRSIFYRFSTNNPTLHLYLLYNHAHVIPWNIDHRVPTNSTNPVSTPRRIFNLKFATIPSRARDRPRWSPTTKFVGSIRANFYLFIYFLFGTSSCHSESLNSILNFQFISLTS